MTFVNQMSCLEPAKQEVLQMETLIQIGGVYHLLCAVIHIFFPRMFQWEGNLKGLTPESRLIIRQNLHIMNICLLLFWLMLAVIPFFFANVLLTTALGKTFLTCIVLFWTIRILVLQPVFVGVKSKESWQMILFFIPGFAMFLLPWVNIMV